MSDNHDQSSGMLPPEPAPAPTTGAGLLGYTGPAAAPSAAGVRGRYVSPARNGAPTELGERDARVRVDFRGGPLGDFAVGDLLDQGEAAQRVLRHFQGSEIRGTRSIGTCHDPATCPKDRGAAYRGRRRRTAP